MRIKLPAILAERMGEVQRRQVGVREQSRWDRSDIYIDLTTLQRERIKHLRAIMVDFQKLKVRGPGVIIRDIDTWFAAVEGETGQKARSLPIFKSLLVAYLMKVPGHRVYKPLDGVEGHAWAYYVAEVQYHPEEKSRDYYSPAYVSMSMYYEEFGMRRSKTVNFKAEDALHKTPSEALAMAGYFVENGQLRSNYLKAKARWSQVEAKLGHQLLASGMASTQDMDGNGSSGSYRWSWRSHDMVNMEPEGEPSKVVVDVVSEGNDQRREASYYSSYFWVTQAKIMSPDFFDEADDITEYLDPPEAPEVPIHLNVPVFDLRRHLRLKAHISQLVDYKYNVKMADNLIIDDVAKALVGTLVDHSRADFEDVVHGKGGGVAVLLTGPPGVGKTLTAEVFAEASKRPLYTVQAAQLGITAPDLEANLLKVLSRGSRWNAVVLIDEADVYIRQRERDLNQNAIVGAFLRVMEYQSSVLFLTTNLGDVVDDAIASRCVARIDYPMPTPDSQRAIWKLLSDVNKIGLTDTDAAALVRDFDVSGRDIKQLLKLAQIVARSRGDSADPATIDFVSQFRPTRSAEFKRND